jgi:hypothetical protein
VGNDDLETTVRCDRARVVPADEQLVPGLPGSNPTIVAEDLTGDPELKGRKTLAQDDGDAVRL